MLVYHYHETTYEYITTTEARLDPLETQIQKKPIYVLPAHATFVAPPITQPVDDFVVVFDTQYEEWNLVYKPLPLPIIEPIPEEVVEEINTLIEETVAGETNITTI